MTKTVDLIHDAFTDVNFDVVILDGVIFDRDSFISVTSEVLGEHETIELKTNETTMHISGSSIGRVIRAKEPSRGLFRDFLSNAEIDVIIVEYKFDYNRQPSIIQRDDVVSVEKSKYTSMALIVETTSSIFDVDFSQVSSVTAIKKQT